MPIAQRNRVGRAETSQMIERTGDGIKRHHVRGDSRACRAAQSRTWQRPSRRLTPHPVMVRSLGVALVPEGVEKVENAVRGVLRDVLGISAERVAAFDTTTPLFGSLPELDSMAVAGLLTELEDRLGILIEDDDIDGETLETFGALVRFASDKALR